MNYYYVKLICMHIVNTKLITLIHPILNLRAGDKDNLY